MAAAPRICPFNIDKAVLLGPLGQLMARYALLPLLWGIRIHNPLITIPLPPQHLLFQVNMEIVRMILHQRLELVLLALLMQFYALSKFDAF